MKRHFFIFSLPRSGSAWLSQFLSLPGSFCYHEPLADGGPDWLLYNMNNRPEACVGAIDTSAYQVPDQIQFSLSCRKFALHRNVTEIARSTERLGAVVDYDVEYSKFLRVASDLQPIYYHRLWDISYLRALWSVIVDQPFDAERAKYFMEMNVQRSVSSVLRRVENRV